MSQLKYLCSPITVRGKTYHNRIVVAPMLMSLVIHHDGIFAPGEVKRFSEFAHNGAGCVIVGETDIDPVWGDRWNLHAQDLNDPEWAMVSQLYTDFSLPNGPKKNSWRQIARVIHEGGALAFAQLFHAGNMRVGLGKVKDRPVAIGPMGYTRKNGEVVKAADEGDMQQICDSFARASAYLKDAGFDGVNIHGGHGWLITQFLSERCNQRTDQYGGSIEKRCNFPVRIMKAIRKVVGDNFIIEVRVSGEETGVPGGYKVEQVGIFSQMVEGIVDIMHISNGHYNLHLSSHTFGGSNYDPHNCNLEQGIFVKQNTKNMLVNVVGGINNPEDSDRLIEEGKIDFISIAKQLYADPKFGNKCMSGQSEDIQRCTRCIYCSAGMPDKEDWDVTAPPMKGGWVETDPKTGKQKKAIREGFCTVNPEHNILIPDGGWPEITAAKKVLVIGGGVAGMMAAITACDRGHFVTLVEKSGRLGGVLSFTDYDQYKVDLKNYRDLLIRRIQNRHINVLFNTTADTELITREAPDVIIAAVGSSTITPSLPGIENTIHALDTYREDFKPGKRVIVIGGGLHACETAINLARTAKDITVLKFSSPDFHDGNPVPVTKQKMDKEGIKYYTNQVLKSINKGAVEVKGAVYPADTIVYSLGMTPRTDVVDAIRAAAGNIPVKAVGDCNKAQDVAHAIRAAYTAAMEIV
jgi:2,4-dienoyl-CoA reductase-like NADH-dependent reductase (Old Yellow Enzyme family)/NADPH-dependent 2,4-dienoyl-CoA reductase/sulfur reductase-like enzyme